MRAQAQLTDQSSERKSVLAVRPYDRNLKVVHGRMLHPPLLQFANRDEHTIPGVGRSEECNKSMQVHAGADDKNHNVVKYETFESVYLHHLAWKIVVTGRIEWHGARMKA